MNAPDRMNKPPPLLLGAALAFWGWQSGFLLPGLLMGLILESARWLQVRWDFSDDDFTRIWTFCTLLFLGAAVYAFTANDGPADFRGFFQDPNFLTRRNAGTSSARTAASLIRWLPMLFFLFVAAQAFSPREGIPVETISLILSRRWKKARQRGKPIPSRGAVNVSWPFFVMCLFAASVHRGEGNDYFWGLCVLLTWALWSQRSRRFGFWATGLSLGAVLGMAYYGQQGLSQFQRYLEGLNPQWLGRFTRRGFDPTRSQTSIGRIGRLKESWQIVVRVQALDDTPPPTLLREASYVAFKAQSWYSGQLQNDFENIQEDPAQRGRFFLLPGVERFNRVRIACSMPGGAALLPLPHGSSRLDDLAAWMLRKNVFGAVMAEGPKLLVFDAQHGPGVTIDTPPDTAGSRTDLEIPEKERRAVEAVAAELGLEGLSAPQAIRKVRAYFAERFAYSTWQGRTSDPGSDLTPLGRFLLKDRKGHCEHFATATVLLLRQAGIPARYAVGYAVHESAGHGKFVVRQRDAHAWCLAWNESRKTWDEVDTTPASWVQLESPAPAFLWLRDFWSRIGFEVSKIRWGQTNLRQYILWALVPALVLLLYQIVFRARRRRKRPAASRPARLWPGLDSEFYDLARLLEKRGLVREIGEPASAWMSRALEDPQIGEMREPLQRLLRLHYRYRFDPQGIDESERRELRSEAEQCARRVGGKRRAATRLFR